MLRPDLVKVQTSLGDGKPLPEPIANLIESTIGTMLSRRDYMNVVAIDQMVKTTAPYDI